MHFIFRKEEQAKQKAAAEADSITPPDRPLWQTTVYFASMVGILVFANWAKPETPAGIWFTIWHNKWLIASGCAGLLGLSLVLWFKANWLRIGLLAAVVAALGLSVGPLPAFVAGFLGLAWISASQAGPLREWLESSWGFAKQIFSLLLAGVLIAGFLLGRAGYEGMIPSEWIAKALGGNSLAANAFASVAGAFMYFATLTEVPIIQGLMGAGMGKGPALALLLAGPALSLPSMLVIAKVMGGRKTFVFVTLVVVFATISGLMFGALS